MFFPIEAGMVKGDLDEFAHSDASTGGQDVVVGFIGLQHPPHTLDVFRGVSPVANGIEVAHVDVLLLSVLDSGDGSSDLASYESLTATGRFVVEQDPVHREHAVGLAIVLGDPEAVQLRRRVRRAGIERCVLILWGRCGAVQLRRRCLVEACLDPG
jgi:hypothetical protein